MCRLPVIPASRDVSFPLVVKLYDASGRLHDNTSAKRFGDMLVFGSL
jgi:hypothetical protein